MAGKSGKRMRQSLYENLEAMRSLQTGMLGVYCHKKGLTFSSLFVKKLKSEGAALLESTEKSGRSL